MKFQLPILEIFILYSAFYAFVDAASLRSARSTICSRLPTSQLCQNIRQRDEPDQAPENTDSDKSMPTPPPLPPSSTDYSFVGPYCELEVKHYFKYCKKKETRRGRMEQFCINYERACFVSTPNPSALEVLTGSTIKPLDQVPIPKDPSLATPPPRSVMAPAYIRMYGLPQVNGNYVYPSTSNSNSNSKQVSTNTGVSGSTQTATGTGTAIGSGTAAATGTAVGTAGGQVAPSQGGISSIGAPLAFLNAAGSPYGPTNYGNGQIWQGMSPFAGASNGNAGIGVGNNVGVGPFANVGTGTQVNPMSGVATGTNINAAGLPISAMKGVSYGGLIPFGIGNGIMG